MRQEAITVELIADMRKAADTLKRATYACGSPSASTDCVDWRSRDLRRVADEFARELAKDLPAMLSSLDCDAARGGTVWRDSVPDHPWLYRYTEGKWWWKTPSGRNWIELRAVDEAKLKLFLGACGPYVAVGQSAGEAH
ncbi:hypothetical protein BKG86_17055 [Mycobacteroides chelonae]|uniref:hypothetical protein n=1 Tax=Mycobacteroides chelonae TaxID=1774 RepID=UPI0008A9E3BB|nr:hypothetical protein [Mycobacteroides chelonae]OHU71362.1 hypothetical protein BKG86_17055 [Mycobacteroides chelonae]